MKRHCILFAWICLMAMVLATACTEKFPGYKKTDDGLYYKFHTQNLTAPKPG